MRRLWFVAVYFSSMVAWAGGSATIGQCTIDADASPGICESRAESPLDQIGLQQGDILLSVNGKKLTNPKTGAQAFRELSSTGRVDKVEVLREGKRKTLVKPKP